MMKMMNGKCRMQKRTAVLVATILFFVAIAAQAKLGLMTMFVDVVVEHLEPGRTYELSELKSQEFSVTNRGDSPVEVRVETEVPQAETLMPGYESIPDLSWIRVEPEILKLGAGESKTGRVILKVPKDRRWTGKHYQVALWSHTLGGTMAVGVRSRIRFSVAASAPVIPASDAKDVRLKIEPASALITEKQGQLTYMNDGKEKIEVTLQSIYAKGLVDIPSGHVAAPNPEFLKTEVEQFSLAPGERKTIALSSTIPKGAAHEGKKYTFAIRAEAASEKSRSSFLSPIFVEVGKRNTK